MKLLVAIVILVSLASKGIYVRLTRTAYLFATLLFLLFAIVVSILSIRKGIIILNMLDIIILLLSIVVRYSINKALTSVLLNP